MTLTQTYTAQDQAARDKIANALRETLFVEAGAGTGKTTSLVGRIVNLVASGETTLDRIAAITFTEAASAELRVRIRSDLEESAADASQSDERRRLCAQGVESLDNAFIQTLHSFAGALLRERPLEAGLPPAFDTMDAIESDIAFDEAWTRWLDEALDDKSLERLFLTAFSLGMTVDHMRRIAQQFHANYDLLQDADFTPPTPADDTPDAYQALTQTLAAAADDMVTLCAYSKLRDDDALYAHAQAKLPLIRRLTALPADHTAYRLLSNMLPLSCGRGRQADWQSADDGVNACRALKALLSDIDNQVKQTLQAVRNDTLLELLEMLKAFVLDYAADRKRQGRAGFHDLLVWARDMLRDDLTARDHFQERFSHLLIDEAQDTDLIQAEIAMFLAEDATEHAAAEARPTDWSAVSPMPGKLFVVGDPKQSIYRFRRADVRQMRRLQQNMRGSELHLTQNFRSQRPVVDWVNALFAEWMNEGSSEQADYTPITHRWNAATNHPAKPCVRWLGDAQDGNMEAVRRSESRQIAALLRQIKAERWQILDRDNTDTKDANAVERYKPAAYSDVCILMPARTALNILEQALDDADIPYRLEGASLFFATQEVRDILNCLKAIDDPSDEIAIVAALRSHAFACTDAELMRFRENGGSFNYLTPPQSDVPAVADALRALHAAHNHRMWTAPAPLIDGFIRQRLLMEAAVSHPRTREQWRRYRFLVEQARAFADAGGSSLRAFLEWVRRQADENARVSESPVPESDEDAVRIMTVHAAKGLEFPIVILTGLNSQPRARREETLFDKQNNRIEVKVGSDPKAFQTAGYDALQAAEADMSADERVRLLYVAATRARDHLVLSMSRPEKNNNSDAHKIAELAEGRSDLWQAVEPTEHATPAAASANGAQPAPPIDFEAHSIQARAEWELRRATLLQERSRPASVAATGLANILKSEADTYPIADFETLRRGRGGAPIGRAVHAVLQTIDLATGEGIEHTARAQAAAEGVPQDHAEIARLANAAVNSDIVRRAVASRRFWREVPVAAPIADGTLEGFIDLLFEEDGELVIVDYKTDAIDQAHTEEYAARYYTQAGCYALAAERATQRRVKEVAFLFLRPKSEQRIHDLTALKAAAEQAAIAHLSAQPPT